MMQSKLQSFIQQLFTWFWGVKKGFLGIYHEMQYNTIQVPNALETILESKFLRKYFFLFYYP